MSFRTRLLSFFVVIVLLPMIAMGILVFRLIADSQQGKADARAAGLASAAAGIYNDAVAAATADAVILAREPGFAAARAPVLARTIARSGLDRVLVVRGGRVVLDLGDRNAIAPATADVRTGARGELTAISVSTLPAARLVAALAQSGAQVIVRQGGRTLAASFSVPASQRFVARALVTLRGNAYREITESFPGFGAPTEVTVLWSLAATAVPNSSRTIAIILIAGFLLLALAFALLSSRALQRQLTRFLQAARRLAGGDFSAPVPSEGNDEFAALAEEFNHMSSQLEARLEELSRERARLREAVRRIGQSFASNLDRPTLLDLALKTALDATQAEGGRVSVSHGLDEPLEIVLREGSVPGAEDALAIAERAALGGGALGRSRDGEFEVLSTALLTGQDESRVHGVLTVARRGAPFSDEEADLLRSMAGQAALALENVDLHVQISRQAVTDELTGLANHGHFQELLSAEADQVRRYGHSLGLIMVDLDNFKSVNDTYGHQQGDRVLRAVAEVLRANSREADWPARYGGEELALILPHTELEGAFAIAERIREAIADLRVERLDGGEPLRPTASLGVAASTDGDRDRLVAQADAALYEAKRAGKNRVVRAASPLQA